MSIQQNKDLVKRFYEEIVSTGDVDRIERFVSDGYTEVVDGTRYSTGLEGARSHIIGVRQTCRDLGIVVQQQIGEGDWVVSCIVATGTHEGRWLGIEPTHKVVSYTGVNVDRVVDGRIVEHGGAANVLGPLLEIGAVRVVGQSE